jgi:hypothetical protein
MESSSIYSEARNEYLKQLSNWIVPPLVEFFRDEYTRISRAEGRTAMRAFQNFCAEVPRWNQDVIELNINKVLDSCKCDYIEELMTAVFIAHTKMLTAIRVSTKQKKLSITLPKLDHFLHRVFVESARGFWKAPFLFSEDLPVIERQKNVLQLETICTDAVSGAVRSLLPVKNILRDYLEEEDSDEEIIEEPKKKKDLKSVKAEESSDDESEIAAPVTSGGIISDMAPVAVLEAALQGTAPSSSSENDAIMSEIIEDAILKVEEIPATKVTQTPVTVTAAAPVSEPVQESEPAPVVLEKLTTPPPPPQPTVSNHEVIEADFKKADVKLEKLETSADPPKLVIDTEPSVHFTPYDTVFDENAPGVSEIRYAEKLSVEEKPPSNWGIFDDDDDEDVPRLSISNVQSSLGLDEIEDLEGPSFGTAIPQTTQFVEEDVDAPLGSTDDFESLD